MKNHLTKTLVRFKAKQNWLRENWFRVWIALIAGVIGLAIVYNQVYLASKRHNLEILRDRIYCIQEFDGKFTDACIAAVKQQRGWIPSNLFLKW